MEFATQLNQTEFEDLVRSRVLLFLSVDIQDSTALKHSPKWFGSVAGFLTGFGPAYYEILGRTKRTKLPFLWKAMGDELVFCVEIHEQDEIRDYLKAFKQAVHDNNTDRKPDTPKLKASAWLADFPHGNVIMPLRREDGTVNGNHYDFIGPQMDIGFRLSRFASTRRFAISIELAWTALHAKLDFEFYWEGLHPVKGLVDRPGYPVLWLDADLSGKQAQSDRGFGRHHADWRTLKKHCREHAEELAAHVRLPFIKNGRVLAPSATKAMNEAVASRYLSVLTLTEPNRKNSADAVGTRVLDIAAIKRDIRARKKKTAR